MTATPKREIAFIDRGVDDLETLLKGLRPDVEPILLSIDEPAPRQMARAVDGREGLEAIHVIAHGRPGEVRFTAGSLTPETLDLYAADLKQIGAAMSVDGRLLLWSCHAAEGRRGQDFVNALTELSGVSVASTRNKVGSAEQGGSWSLDVVARPPLSKIGIVGYAAVLDGTTVDNLNVLDTSKTNDTGGTEYVTLQEVANALFPTTNATQTLTIDASFWTGNLRLTFSIGGATYTIWGAGTGTIDIAQTDSLGSYASALTSTSSLTLNSAATTSTDVSQFLSWMGQQTGVTTQVVSSSLLVTADIDGGAGKDNIQGIASNVAIHNIIQGGAGADVLTGGVGSDYFVYTSATDSPAAGQLNSGGQPAQTWDQITNFTGVNTAGSTVANQDKIDFGKLVADPTALTSAQSLGLTKLFWLQDAAKSGNPMQGAAYSVWWTSDGSGGSYIFADTNGDGNADLKIDLAGYSKPSLADFIGVANTTGTISINAPIAGDDTVNASEAANGFTIAGTTVGVAAGQTVTVQVVDGSNHVIDTYTATVAANSWSVTVPAGGTGTFAGLANGTYTVQASVLDVDNHLVQGSHAITVDEVAPTGGTPDLIDASDSGSLHTDNITNVTAPTFTVALNPTVAAGDTVELLLGGSSLSRPVVHTITAAEVAAHSVSLTVMAGDLGIDGAKSISAKFTDTASNTSTTGVLSFTLDTSEAKPTVVLASDTGSSNSDGITSNASVTVSGQDSAATIAYKVDGAATFSATYDPAALGDGAHTIQVQATDTAGNVSVSDVLSFTLDTSEAKPTVVLASDTGSSNSDGITSNASVTVSGQDSAATIAYKVDGAATFSATYDPAALGDGAHTIQVQATDTAGNVSVSDVLSFTLDTSEAKPTVVLASDTGSSNSDGITSNASVTVSGQDSAATIAYKVDGAATFSATYDPAALGDGAHTIQVQATDTAGNVSVSDVLSFTLDTSEAKPTVVLASDTGSSNSDGITSNASVTVSGQDSAATIAYKVDGAATFSATYDPAALGDGAHTIQVQATDTAGNVSVSDVLSFTLDTSEAKPTVVLASDTGSSNSDGITSNASVTVSGQDSAATIAYKVDGAATFSATYDPAALGDGAHTIQVQATDTAGNVSVSDVLSFTLDTSEAKPTVVLASDTGSSNSDGITSNASVTVSGQDSAATIAYKVDGAATFSATYDPAALGDGAHTIQVQATDTAGNVSVSDVLSFTLDTSEAKPTVVLASDTGSSNSDGITSNASVTVSGQDSAATIAYKVDGAATFSATYDPAALGDGAHTIQVQATDTAGNVSVSDVLSFTLDTSEAKPTVVLASDTGSSNSDGITSNASVTVSGQDSAATIAYKVDGAATFSATYDPAALGDGAHTIQVQATDTAGNVSVSDVLSFTLDTSEAKPTVVLASDTGSSNSDGITSNASVTVSGQDSAATIAYKVDGAATFSATYDPAALGDGAHTIQVQATDTAGNVSVSDVLSFTLDTSEAKPTVVLASDTGSSNSDGITSNASVTVSGQDSAATIAYKVDGAATFSATYDPAALGDGAHTIQVQATDTAGNVSVSDVLSFTLDTSEAKPTVVLASDTGSSNSDGITSNASVTVSGQDSAATIAYKVDGAATFSATYDPAALGDGAHTIQVQATDTAGNVSVSDVLSFTLDTSEAKPTVVLASDTGSSNSDGITSNASVTVSGQDSAATIAYKVDGAATFSATYDPAALGDGAHTIQVQATDTAGNVSVSDVLSFTLDTSEAKPTVVLASDTGSSNSDGITSNASVTVSGQDSAATIAYKVDGAATFSATYDPAALGDGAHTIQVQATDTAGNVSVSDVLSFTLDTSEAKPTVVLASDTGSSNSDGITSNASVTVSGQDSAATIAYKVDGAATFSATYDPAALGDGAHTIQVQATDTAGNVSVSDVLSFTLDTSEAKPTVVLASDTGSSNSDGITSNASVTVSGQDSAATIAYKVDGAATFSATYDPAALGDGAHTIQVQATDTAGNVSVSDVLSFTLDTSEAKPTVVLASDTGSSNSDGITSNASVTVSGQDSAATIAYKVDGAATFSATYDPAALGDGAHTIQVQATDTAGNVSVSDVLSFTLDTSEAKPTVVLASDTGSSNSDGITSNASVTVSGQDSAATIAYKVDGAATFSATYDPAALGDGAHTIQVQATDTAGNVSVSDVLSFTLDTSEAKPTVVLASDTGSSNSDGITSNASVTVSGQDSAATIAYKVDGAATFSATYDPAALGDGAHTIQVQATDTAGNVSVSDVLSFTLDTSEAKPTVVLASDTGSSNSDGITSNASVTVSGQDSAATIAYKVDGAATFSATYDPAALGDGAHTIQVQATDTAGNVSVSDVLSFTLDTSEAKPTVVLASDTGSSNSDGITSNASVTVSGQDSAATIAYKVDGAATFSATYDPAALGDGAHTIQVQATDTAGNVSVSDVLSFTLDTSEAKPTVVLASDTGSSNSDGITSNASVTVSGQDSAATIAYKVDGAATFSATYDPAALGDGAHTIQVQATDTAGNVSVSDVLSFTLDTSEAKPTVVLASDTGSSNSDGITSNASVTVSGQDSAATIAYKVDGAATFSATYDPAALGDGAHTIQVQATDTAGNVSVSDVLSFTLDTSEAKPTVVLASDTGSSNSDGITSNASVTVSGQDSAATIAYKVDGAATFSATYDPAALGDGAHTIQVQATDTAGNVSVSDVLSFTLDTSEAKPTVVLASDTGSSNSDGITSNASVTVSGQDSAATIAYKVDGAATFSATYDPAALGDGAHTIQVQATDTAGNVSVSDVLSFTLDTSEAKPTVVLASDTGSSNSDGITSNASVTVSGQDSAATIAYKVDGAATFSATYDPAALGDGAHTIQVQATDTAGNVSVSDVLSFTLDTSEAKPTVVLASDTGSSNSDGITSNASVTVSGQDSAATIAYKVDGAATFSATYDPAALGDGAHTIQVQATDTAGNVSVSDVLSFTLDTHLPVAPTLALGTGVANGATAAEATQASGVVTVSDESGASIAVTFTNGIHTVTKTVTGTGSAQAVTLTSGDLTTLTDGTISVSAIATDAAGNTSSAGTTSFVLDTHPPAAPTLALGTGVANGATAAEATQAGGVVTVSDESGASIAVTFTNGIHTVTKTVTGTGSAQVVTLTSGDLTTLTDGTISVSAIATDAAGNTSSAGTTSFVLDTHPPAAPTLALGTGVANGATAAEATQAGGVVTVSDESGASIAVTFTNGIHTVTKTVTGTGSAQAVTLTSGDLTTLTDGTISVSAIATDAAGNTSSAGTTSFVLDTHPPAAPTLALGTGVANGATAAEATQAGGVVTVSDESGASIAVTFTNGIHTVTKTVTGTGSAQVVTLTSGDLTTLTDGTISVSAIATDAAGNTSSAGTTSFVLDANPTLQINTVQKNATTISGTFTDVTNVSSITVKDGTTTLTGTLTIDNTNHTWTLAGIPSNQKPNTGDSISATATDAAGNTLQATTTTVAPAGVSGEPINLGLTDSSVNHVGSFSLTIAGVLSGWSVSEGTNNGDGTWTVVTNDVASLSITSPAAYTGALVLNITETWTNADGSTGHATVVDNVEAYAAGSPIFALSGDDFLTASSGHDLLVFSQPIGHDTVYSFDVAADQIDLIGYAGFASFSDIQAHTADDGAGDAVITLGDGQTITLHGVDAASLNSSDFVFDQTPETDISVTMTIDDGAVLPLSGIIHNTGTISLNSTGDETDLQLIEHGITLDGHGQVVLSDSSENFIVGTVSDVTLTNVDNTITGAGHLGDGFMALVNEGTIIANGTNALDIDTGTNTIVNSGTLEATGSGGLVIDSDVANSGVLWANNGNIVANGNVSGGSALISGSATLEFAGASSADAKFDFSALGTLKLDHSVDFTGTVSGLASGNQLDLHDILFGASTTESYTANQAGTGGTLTVSDGVHTANIVILGQYSGNGFTTSVDNGGGTLVTYHDPHSVV
ncbi:Ig-like domain-containing protein [Bradyrhizobium sp. AZCC 2289]|uniref:Ig-like domain-containing protein n=1 Tax=Bradyrhizobium sp. AZCC 2289 TaxID=3117026 RepID=UPI002FF2357B